MRLGWLEIRDFRCHDGLEFGPDPEVNVLVGDNSTGKTTILEAIGYLATLKSFRRSPDSSLVRSGADSAVVRGEFAAAATSALVEAEIPVSGRRRVLLGGKPARSRAEVVSQVALVAFLPDDLDLVKRGPALRREWVDDLASGLWPAAAVEQVEYERALRQRNTLLKQEGRRADLTTLGVWDERISTLGATMIARRLTALEAAGPALQDIYGELAPTGRLSWAYVPSAGEAVLDGDDRAAALLSAITAVRNADLDRRVTTVGPHRDEITLSLDGRDVRTRASQGEQRSVALGLRLATARLVAEHKSTAPVVLLDDVFSELDPERGRRLVALLPPGQVVVTSAHPREVPVGGRLWVVTGGRIEEAA